MWKLSGSRIRWETLRSTGIDHATFHILNGIKCVEDLFQPKPTDRPTNEVPASQPILQPMLPLKNPTLPLAAALLASGISPLAAQSTYEQRHDAYFDDISTRRINTGQTDGPHRAGRTGFWTTQGKLQRGNESSGVWSNLSSTIANADGEPDAYGANGGFSGWPGMDTYLRWQHRFPQWIKDQYYTEYTTMPTYGRGSTPNQRIMWAAACKLACETWGVPAVTSVSNAANRYGDPTGKAYMMAICNRTVKYNFEERWAKHYLQYTLGPLRSIADLSTDAELANRARMTWNWGWMDIASFSFKGRWAIPAGRGSMTQDGNSSDISEFGSWLMFEGSPRANPLDMDQSLLYTQPRNGQAHLVTQPPIIPEMLEAATDRSKPFTRRGMARVHETQFATSYLTKDWALYSQLEADTTLNADGTLKIKDLNNGGVPSNDWSSERWAVMWDETGAAGLTMKAPTGYGWCQGCGLGPHEDIVQHEGTITGIFNIPATSNWQYTRDSIPTNTTAVINDSATTGRLYLHYSKVLVAITRSDIGNFTWPPAAQTFCNKRGYAVECASLDEYPQSTAAARLAAFKADIEANPPDFSHVNDAVPRMIYTTRDGTVLDVTYGEGGKINNDPVDYTSWPLHESPWARQDQMGNMWVFGKDRHLLWNYKNWTERSDYRPTATTSAPVAAATSVDIDLSTRVTDTETPAADLNYRITASNNGSAVILADGKTARFTPAANFAGESNFTFSAGGQFPDQRFIFHYDYEQADPLAGGIVQDQSTNNRHATASVGGFASLTGEPDLPAALGSDSTKSLRVVSSNFGSAKLSRQIHPATLNFSNHDWTFATWFKRASYADEDFLFYIGNSDGNSGNVDELQLSLPAQSKTLALRHWTAANVLDVNLSTAPVVNIGEWNHVAVQYDRTSFNTGVMKLFLNGKLVATTAPITFALNQTGPVFIGGPAANTVLNRNFNGWLDDTVLARGELSAGEIDTLATATASHLGGVKLEQTVRVIAGPLPPGSLAATTSNNTIQLTWSASSGAASYTVKRATSALRPLHYPRLRHHRHHFRRCHRRLRHHLPLPRHRIQQLRRKHRLEPRQRPTPRHRSLDLERRHHGRLGPRRAHRLPGIHERRNALQHPAPRPPRCHERPWLQLFPARLRQWRGPPLHRFLRQHRTRLRDRKMGPRRHQPRLGESSVAQRQHQHPRLLGKSLRHRDRHSEQPQRPRALAQGRRHHRPRRRHHAHDLERLLHQRPQRQRPRRHADLRDLRTQRPTRRPLPRQRRILAPVPLAQHHPHRLLGGEGNRSRHALPVRRRQHLPLPPRSDRHDLGRHLRERQRPQRQHQTQRRRRQWHAPPRSATAGNSSPSSPPATARPAGSPRTATSPAAHGTATSRKSSSTTAPSARTRSSSSAATSPRNTPCPPPTPVPRPPTPSTAPPGPAATPASGT
jgi:hypothetical protein